MNFWFDPVNFIAHWLTGLLSAGEWRPGLPL